MAAGVEGEGEGGGVAPSEAHVGQLYFRYTLVILCSSSSHSRQRRARATASGLSSAWRAGGGKEAIGACALCVTSLLKLSNKVIFESIPAAGRIHVQKPCVLGVRSTAQRNSVAISSALGRSAVTRYQQIDMIR